MQIETDQKQAAVMLAAGRSKARAGQALVVEADPTLRELMGVALTEANWQATLVFDVREALRIIHLHEPQVIVLDAQTAARELEMLSVGLQLNCGYRPPILAVGTRSGETECSLFGAYDFLGVPFEAEDFTALVERGRALYERSRHLRMYSETAVHLPRQVRTPPFRVLQSKRR